MSRSRRRRRCMPVMQEWTISRSRSCSRCCGRWRTDARALARPVGCCGHEVLGLSPDQAVRFDSAQSHAWGQRRQLMIERRRINQALQGQMQPGMAANADSVSKLLDARRRVTQSLFQVDDQEDHELAGFLNPVQRARYQEF